MPIPLISGLILFTDPLFSFFVVVSVFSYVVFALRLARLAGTIHDFLFLKRTLLFTSRLRLYVVPFDGDNFSYVLLIRKSLPSLSLFSVPCFGTAKVRTFFASATFILNYFCVNFKYLFPHLRAAKVSTFSAYSNAWQLIFESI